MYRLAMLLLLSGTALGTEFRLLDPDYLGLEYRRHQNYRDSFFQKYEVIEGECTEGKECFTFGASLLFDLTVLQLPLSIQGVPLSLYWKNDIIMDSTQRQVRQVGWKWELGIPVGKHLEFFQRHHSRHVLEDTNSQFGFPLRDEYVIRFNILNRRDR